jgi:hypothetical protein
VKRDVLIPLYFLWCLFVFRVLFGAAVPAAGVRVHSGGNAHLRQHERLENNPHDDEYNKNQTFHSVDLDAPGIDSFQHFVKRYRRSYHQNT